MSTKPHLSDREMEILSLALQSLKNPEALSIDYKKLSELAGFKTAASATASWLSVKKKVCANSSSPDNAPAVSGDDATPVKAKAAPKKRTPKAKAGVSPDGGAAADDEQTPSTSPKKTAPAKRKATTPDNNDGVTIDAAEATPTPAKKPRGRKPKDPNAPPPKPRTKKAKAEPASVKDEVHDAVSPNTQLVDEAEGEDGAQTSMFGGDIKGEHDDDNRPFSEDEKNFVDEKMGKDKKIFGAFSSGEAGGVRS